MKKALIILAAGFEEIEVVTPIDLLRRANLEVVVAGLEAQEVTGAHGMTVRCDCRLAEVRGVFDALILPGGMPGASNLHASEEVNSLILQMAESGKVIAAICASPVVVLAPTGILSKKEATCFPGMEKQFPSDVLFLAKPVVVAGKVITSQGVGTALSFALKIIELLAGEGESSRIGKAVLAL